MLTFHAKSYFVRALAATLAVAATGLFAQGPACPVGTNNSVVTTMASGEAANTPIKSTNFAAQTFTTPGAASDCIKLNALTFSVQKKGSPGALTLTIYTVNTETGAPGSPIPNASAVVDAVAIATSLSDQSVAFSNPPSLTGGSMYAAVFSSGSTTGSNDYKLGVVSTNPSPGGPYAGGSYWQTSGSSWEAWQGGKVDVRMALCFTPCSGGCTLTLGYWKNPKHSWPTTSLTLGSVSYSQAELLAILNQAPAGNDGGLISLAHQLIAAKLNIANGAAPWAISDALSAADALIGGLVIPPVGYGSLASSATSALNNTLDSYNQGVIGPGHCAE